jgi:cytoskeletal protein CcmA (bactofilin family)
MFGFGSSKQKKDIALSKERFATLVGQRTTMKGDLELHDSIRIDGRLEGNTLALEDSKISVVVGPSGYVAGNITANRVVVAGTVLGAIKANEEVDLQATAIVQGDVHCKSLRVVHGAQLIGRTFASEHTQLAQQVDVQNGHDDYFGTTTSRSPY